MTISKELFHIFLTQIWRWWFIVDPLYDFKAILSSDYSNTGSTRDEVLQRHTALQCAIAQMQWAKFY